MNLKLKIPKKCPVKWENLDFTDCDKKRYCTICKKNVFDFTSSTNEEIYITYKKNNGKLCGLLNRQQINHNSNRESFLSKKYYEILNSPKNWINTLSFLLINTALLLSSCVGDNDYRTTGEIKIERHEKDSLIINDSIKKQIKGDNQDKN
ncbi:MAG: hypothetical protein ACK5AY_13350 [Bacteroidota bacterium]